MSKKIWYDDINSWAFDFAEKVRDDAKIDDPKDVFIDALADKFIAILEDEFDRPDYRNYN